MSVLLIFPNLSDTSHILSLAELDQMRHHDLNLTVDERTPQIIEELRHHLNKTRDKELDWMQEVVRAYRKESNDAIKNTLSGFGDRFENEKSEVSREFNEQISQIQQLIDQEGAKLVQEIEDLQNGIKKAKEEFDSNDEELKSLQRSIRNADVNKDEVTFVFEVDNIAEFLKDETNERRLSEYFQCRGILWYLDVSQSALSDGRKVLSGVLHSHNPDRHPWYIRVDFDLFVLNQSGKENSPTLSHENAIFRSEGNSNFDDNLGWTNLIEIEKLENGGFIKEDKIKLQLKLKTLTKLIRGMAIDEI